MQSFAIDASRSHSNPAQSGLGWLEFCRQPQTAAALEAEAVSWLEAVSGFSVPSLRNGKNRLGKKGEKGSPVAFFQSGVSPEGVPFINLTFSTFRNGGWQERFDSRAALQQLWESFHSGHRLASKIRTQPQPGLIAREASQRRKAEEERQARTASVAADLALWETLAPTGSSAYLSRKGVRTAANGCAAIRHGTDSEGRSFIAALVEDITGQPLGLQKIGDDSEKRFTYGLAKQGAFIRLGTPAGFNPKRPSFVVCEGLATGLSLRAALGDEVASEVLCALDAGNLAPVVAALRAQYGPKSRCRIVIAADNDQWKAEKLERGEPLGNTGLIKAHQTALKYRCQVVVPCFEGMDTEGQPTDFNDLHRLAGLEAVRKQLAHPQKPDPHFAFFKARHKAVRRLRQWFGGVVIECQRRYLGDFGTDIERIAQAETLLVRSGIGTGKTQLVKNHILPRLGNQSVLYISHLVALATDAAQRLGFELYSDYKGRRTPSDCAFSEVQTAAICLNSLPMLAENGSVRCFDVVVIDEIEQLLRRLTTRIEHKRLVLGVLRHLIAQAKQVVVLDAHLSPLTKLMLELWRPNRRTVTVLNEYHIGAGRTVILHEKPDEVMAAALAELQRDGRVFLTCNSKKTARTAFKLFEAEAPGKRGLYISGDNSGDPEVLEFFRDVNGQARCYDYIVVSPSVSTGVSINEGHGFSFVGGIFTHSVNTPADCLQALGRVRGMEQLHVWVSDVKNAKPTAERDIAARWESTHQHDRPLMGLDSQGETEILDGEYHRQALAVAREENFATNDFLSRFLEMLDADGYRVTYHEADEPEIIVAGMLAEEAKVLEADEFLRTRVSAPDLETDTAAILERKHRRTFAETRALDKHHLKEFYRLPETAAADIVAAVIEKDRRGQRRTEISHLEIALATDEQLREAQGTHNQTADFLPDQRNLAAEREFSRMVLQAVGIEPARLEPNPNHTYSKTSPAIVALVAWLRANRGWIGGILRMPPDERLTADPLRFVSKALRRLGLRQRRIGRHAKGEYCLDVGGLYELTEVLWKRGTHPQQCGDTSRYKEGKAGNVPSISNKLIMSESSSPQN
ncbi:MAG: toprim domain-containing protein [Blastocatellia bacterium]|nr:toprim domain-containing protein [Blastocatellia bacterium]